MNGDATLACGGDPAFDRFDRSKCSVDGFGEGRVTAGREHRQLHTLPRQLGNLTTTGSLLFKLQEGGVIAQLRPNDLMELVETLVKHVIDFFIQSITYLARLAN